MNIAMSVFDKIPLVSLERGVPRGHNVGDVAPLVREGPSLMRLVLFLAVVANSLDLLLTSVGIHWFGNREGNPLLAPFVHQNWIVFVLLKGVLVPLLIVRLYRYRQETPVLATAGMGLVMIALTVALGQWLGWMAGVVAVGRHAGF